VDWECLIAYMFSVTGERGTVDVLYRIAALCAGGCQVIAWSEY
jgi:hypothetical protein